MRLKELLEKRANIWEQMKETLEDAEKNGGLTGERLAKYENAERELDTLTEEIEALQRAAEIEKKMTATNEPRSNREVAVVPAEDRYAETFEKYLRNGMRMLDRDDIEVLRNGVTNMPEVRALGIGTGGAGLYTVPPGFRQVITEQMKFFGGMRQVANVINTAAGNTLNWPANNDTGNVGAILAENTQMSQLDVAFTQKTLGAYMYTSNLVLVSWQLLEDTAFDIEAFLGRKLGQRVGRIQNTHFTTGTGTGQPTGLVTAGTVGVTLPTGNTTTITYAGLIDLISSVDPAYRNGGNAGFMMSDTARATIRKMTDSQNRPLWEPSIQVGNPDQVLGYPITINNDMPVPGVSAKSVAFGDFRAGYIIRDVVGFQMVRLDERYADFLQAGFFGFARSDGQADDTAAYRLLQHSAT